MSESTTYTGEGAAISYELTLTSEELRQGASKLLPRNNKRLEVKIPPGVVPGTVVKLRNALQVTDGRPGDILIIVRSKSDETGAAENAPPSPPSLVVEIEDGNFDAEVMDSQLPVVVDFWAPWCSPCRAMAPIMEEAAGLYEGRLKFCKINVDQNPEAANRYRAMSIPLLVFFKNGEAVERSLGAVPLSELRAKLDLFLKADKETLNAKVRKKETW